MGSLIVIVVLISLVIVPLVVVPIVTDIRLHHLVLGLLGQMDQPSQLIVLTGRQSIRRSIRHLMGAVYVPDDALPHLAIPRFSIVSHPGLE